MSTITTHVLDTARGEPASGVHVRLERLRDDNAWLVLGDGFTDADGRVVPLVSEELTLSAGHYRLTFETGRYYADVGTAGFYPVVQIVFHIRNPGEHHHVPLLLSPFGYTTYRGS